MRLNKPDALAFVSERAEIFDAVPNAFGKTAWLLHFIEQVIDPNWELIVSESLVRGESVMLLYDDGRGVKSLANYYSGLWSPAATTTQQAPLRHMVELLRRYPSINFGPLDDAAPATMALQHALASQRWYVRPYTAHANWYLPGRPYAEYLSQRDSQLRNTISRKGKKFPGELRIVTSPDEVDAAMDAYDAVYARSWKVPEPYPNFVRGWARICAENGWLRLGIATLDGAPIAAHFWFVVDGVASIFKLAYDEEHSKLSAGTLLTAMLMQHVLDVDRVSEVDFLSGDDPYKAAWMTHRRERIGFMACNLRTVRGASRAAFEWVGELRQRLSRRHETPRGAPVTMDGTPDSR